jgi:hypothetical protein
MTQCPSTAQVMPGGAIIRCELEAGHDNVVEVRLMVWEGGTPHSCTLTWTDPKGVVIDPELYDPDEKFDLEVDIDPVVEASHPPTNLCGTVCCQLCGEVCVLTPHDESEPHTWARP